MSHDVVLGAADGPRSVRSELGSLDLSDPVWFVDGPPRELFAQMRRECPVRWNLTSCGGDLDGFWSLTRDRDITTVSRDHATFSSAKAGVFLHPDQLLPLEFMRSNILAKDSRSTRSTARSCTDLAPPRAKKR
jgi:hypothetical protein